MEIEDWQKESKETLSLLSERFLTTSYEAIEREAAQQRELNLARQRTMILTGGLIVALVLTVVATLFGVNANRAEQKTIQQSRAGLAQSLAAQAQVVPTPPNLTDTDLQTLLALESIHLQEVNGGDATWLADQALRNVLMRPDWKRSLIGGHTASVLSVAFSPDGKRVASGSSDQSIRIWDMENVESQPVVLEGHTDSVLSVVFSPDGKRVASGSEDQSIRIWSTLEKLKQVACERVSRNLTETEWDFYIRELVSYRSQCDLEERIPSWDMKSDKGGN